MLAVLALSLLMRGRGASAQATGVPAVTVPGVAASQPRGTVLRWAFQPGRVVRYRTYTSQGGAATTHHATSALLDLETVRVLPSGVAEQRLRVSELRVWGRMRRVVRDLALDEGLGRATVPFTRDTRGQVTAAPTSDAVARALVRSIELIQPTLPEGPVSVGESWTIEQRVPLALGLGMGFDLLVRSTYTLRRIGSETDARAVIDVAEHLQLGPGSQVSGMPASGEGDALGLVVIVPSRGLVLSSRLAGHIDLVGTAPSGHPTTRVNFQTDMRLEPDGVLVPTGHDAGRASPVPWLSMLALTMRQSMSRVAAPNVFPHFEMAGVATFAFDDVHLLDRRQHNSGAVWLTPNARPGSAVPLLIYLHGVNRHRILHRWMHGSDRDMRTIVGPMALEHLVGPMAVAVPSTTGDSAQTQLTLYPRFDVSAFIDAVDRALAPQGFRVDRQRVILSGHSAAGCVRHNGFLNAVGSPAVRVLLDIDCCMNEHFAQILASAPPAQRVIVAYQDHMWNADRDYSSFAWNFRRLSAGVDPAQRVLQYYRASGPDAHNDMVQIVLRDWLPRLVPPVD
ncbi:MAG: hypothetical protein WCJ30_09545 [Deltaproteobacteria bacterium]